MHDKVKISNAIEVYNTHGFKTIISLLFVSVNKSISDSNYQLWRQETKSENEPCVEVGSRVSLYELLIGDNRIQRGGKMHEQQKRAVP